MVVSSINNKVPELSHPHLRNDGIGQFSLDSLPLLSCRLLAIDVGSLPDQIRRSKAEQPGGAQDGSAGKNPWVQPAKVLLAKIKCPEDHGPNR